MARSNSYLSEALPELASFPSQPEKVLEYLLRDLCPLSSHLLRRKAGQPLASFQPNDGQTLSSKFFINSIWADFTSRARESRIKKMPRNKEKANESKKPPTFFLNVAFLVPSACFEFRKVKLVGWVAEETYWASQRDPDDLGSRPYVEALIHTSMSFLPSLR